MTTGNLVMQLMQMGSWRARSKPDYQASLIGSALDLSHELYPELDLSAAVDEIERMVRELGARLECPYRPGDALYLLNTYLFDELGYMPVTATGETPNANLLHQVVEQRSGSAISIALLYLEIGRRIGLPLEGVRFGECLLVCYQQPSGITYIDPAAGGLPLDSADLVALLLEHPQWQQRSAVHSLLYVVPPREILLRLLTELKQVFTRLHLYEKALQVINRMLAINPGLASAVAERALLYEELDCLGSAVTDYQSYLAVRPTAAGAVWVRERLAYLLAHPVAYH